MTSGKSLRSSGTESRVLANDLLLCHDVLDPWDHNGEVDVPRAFQTRHVRDVGVPYHPYVRFSLVPQ